MSRNSDYWKERTEALEDEQYRESLAYYEDIKEQFKIAQMGIQDNIEKWYRRLADNNGVSYTEAKKLLKKGELEEFKWTLDQYIQKGRENAVSEKWVKELENASARYHISYYEAMKIQIQHHAELLYGEFEKGMADFIGGVFKDQFYKTAFEISKGTGIGISLAAIDEKKINAVIKSPWAQDGKVFSDRIWNNKEKLVRKLHTELVQNIIRGESPQKAISSLAKKMNVSKAQAGTLIMTEAAAASAVARKKCFSELDVDRYQFDATLDGKTCDICGALDGKVFKMSEYEIGITANPLHPNCRCCTVPYFDEWYGLDRKRVARDPLTGKEYKVPADMTYQEWKDKFVLNSKEEGALIRYVSPDSYSLNDKLRRGEELTVLEKEWSQTIDNALEKLPFYEGNLNRSLTFLREEDAQNVFNDFRVGEDFISKQYLSTTKQGVYNEDAQIQIYIQNTKKGKDLGSLNNMEKEVLYPAGSQFKVLDKVNRDGKYFVLMEEK